MPDLFASLTIALAGPEDAEPVAELSRTAIEYGLPWRWTPPRVARCIADPSINVVVARMHGQRAGFAVMRYDDEDAHLWLFAVEPRWRRLGIGSALLDWLEATVRAAGIVSIHLEARLRNEEGRAFYRRLGYVERELVPRRYLGVEDGIRLVKTVAPVLATDGPANPAA